jgi:hypothetical protein
MVNQFIPKHKARGMVFGKKQSNEALCEAWGLREWDWR